MINNFNKYQGKLIMREIDKTHKGEPMRLISYKPYDSPDRPVHFPEAEAMVPYKNASECFHAFRKRFPHGRYMISILVGEDKPAVPDKSLPIYWYVPMLWYAIYTGTATGGYEAPVLFLDTNWVDKAEEYQKAAVYRPRKMKA